MKVVTLREDEKAQKPDEVLEAAKGEYEKVLVVGYSKHDGFLDARATLNMTDADVLLLIERFKHFLIENGYDYKE